MIGVVRACPLFTKMVDSFAPISAGTASALKSVGIGAVGRYLQNLTAPEVEGLFAAGLGILPLSEAPNAPLGANFGRAYATTLLQYASALGVPRGTHLMIDLEAQHGDRVDIIAYNNALSADLELTYIPLVYVGAGQPLSGADLYALPSVHLYWRGGSLGMAEPNCGFAIWQIPPLEQTIVGGAVMDMSMTGADLRGRQPMLWYPN